MPNTCPHCGFRLPIVVDAYCPECREDLSEPPLSDDEGAPAGLADPQSLWIVSHGIRCACFAVSCAFITLFAGVYGQWALAAGAGLVAVLFGALTYVSFRPPGNATSVTGRESTRNED